MAIRKVRCTISFEYEIDTEKYIRGTPDATLQECISIDQELFDEDPQSCFECSDGKEVTITLEPLTDIISEK